ncbi:MAG: protein kinase [Chitinivibrionales bacterium]|nr:protein kinase [Chitinivibrionales bacterium]
MKLAGNNQNKNPGSAHSEPETNQSASSLPLYHSTVYELFGRPLKSDKYTIHENLAEGGMGVIYRADDQDIGREVALKTIGAEEDKERCIRFINEARITGRLEHPNIVPLHDFSINKDGLLYFTMKLVKGRSLKDILQEYRNNPDDFFSEKTLAQLIDIFIDICNAVAYAHSKSIIHRDLKPANIMIGDYGEVQVMDWGLAKSISHDSSLCRTDRNLSETSTGLLVLEEDMNEDDIDGKIWGTIAYMPPEQAKGALHDIDERSDIFALGAILYELLTLNPPIQGNTPKEMIEKARTADIVPIDTCVPPSRHIPGELSAIATKALSESKCDRYQNVDELKHDIDLYLGNKPVSAKEDSTWETIVKLIKRSKAVSISTGIALIILLFSGIFFTYLNIQEREKAEQALRSYRQEQKEKMALIQKDIKEREREWVLVFEDNFSDPDFLKHWDIIYGQYKVINGSRSFVPVKPDCKVINGEFCIKGGTPQTLLLKQPMTGDIAIEFDCHQESNYLNDISCLFDVTRSTQLKRVYSNGYLLQYGSQDNTSIRALRANAILWQKYESPVVKGKHYHIRAERVGNHLTMTVNGKVVIDIVDDKGLHGKDRNTVGITGWGSELWIDNVKIFKMGTPLKEDALELAGRQLHKGNFTTAYDIYREIYDGAIDPTRKMSAFKGMENSEYLIMVQNKLPYYKSLLQKVWPNTDFTLAMIENGLSFEIGNQNIRHSITSLSPLRYMPLSRLDIHNWSSIKTLSPLTSMDLRWLNISKCTSINDISPLRGMPLVFLNMNYCKNISSINPLRHAQLTTFYAYGTSINDLSALKGMPLNSINIQNCIHVSDISALKGAPLEIVYLNNVPTNNCAAVAQPELKFLDASGMMISSIEPLRDIPLKTLKVEGCSIGDFSPLATMDLFYADLTSTDFYDLHTIENLKLSDLILKDTPVKDLSSLKNTPLSTLDISYTDVTDLSPIKNKDLLSLNIQGLKLDSSALEIVASLPLIGLSIDITNHTRLKYIKKCQTIKYINGLKKEYVFKIMPAVFDALSGKSGATCSLMAFAERVGDRYYLPVPTPFDIKKAQTFCKMHKGSLVSPTNNAIYNNLKTWLGTKCTQNAQFFLGLVRTPPGNELGWDSGAKNNYQEFESTWDKEMIRKKGAAYFMPNSHYAGWLAPDNISQECFVIEWREDIFENINK